MFTQINVDKYIAVRHEIHRYPELKYQEFKTAEKVANMLSAMGYEVTTGIGKVGVVGLLDTGKPGPVIAFRADMDALPIHELNDLPYKSTIDGCMHACGHDGHTASLLSAAEAFMANKSRYRGKIKLIFQPAEEGGAGAKAMIDDGVLENPYVDAIFGFHNRPGFESGLLFAKPGSAMGGNTSIEVTIHGKGGHAAMPHLAVDPIVTAAQFVTAVQSVVSRKLSPLQSGVITVAQFNAGKASNVIAETAHLALSVRSDSPQTRDVLVKGIEESLAASCQINGSRYDMNIELDIPALVNDPVETDRVIAAFRRYEASTEIEKIDYMPTMGAEDFAFYLMERPGCYFFIGNGKDSAYLHNPHYDFDDRIIDVASRAYLSIAEHYLGKETIKDDK